MTSCGSASTAFHAERKALIAEERARGHHHRSRTLSAKEGKAIEIIQQLRQAEYETLWNETTGAFHSMPFTSAKTVIGQSKLFALLQQMPKGCLLHCHLDAMNNPENLLALAFSHSSLCVSSDRPLLPDSLASAVLTFINVPISDPVSLASLPLSIYAEDYVAHSLAPLAAVRRSFPAGAAAFDLFVVSKLVVTPQSRNWSNEETWAHFQSTFIVSGGLIGYEPVFEEYVAQVFRTCADDSVSYLECRINFLSEFMISESGHLDWTHRLWLESYDRAVNRVKAERINDLERPFTGSKIIYTTIRFVDAGAVDPDTVLAPGEFHRMRWYMEDCIALKKEFPHLIAGFDLVGYEDGLRPLIYYIEDLLWFKARCKEESLDIPFIFHAGETLTDGGAADQNLYDAILLDTKRIGHGFSLPKHPLLMEICKERGIVIESCPISNELLRYTNSTMTHPIALLLNYNIPVSLSCDDPQFFGNVGLSYDFYQVFTSSEQMDIIGLGELARKSIGYSMMSVEEKEIETAAFDVRFDGFLDLVVAI